MKIKIPKKLIKILKKLRDAIASAFGLTTSQEISDEEYEIIKTIRSSNVYKIVTDEEELRKLDAPTELPVADIKPEGPITKQDGVLSSIAFTNLVNTLYRTLDDMKLLPDGKYKDYVILDIKKAFQKCGMEVVEYDGTNKEFFDIKESCDCSKEEMGTPTIRDSKTKCIKIKGVVFVPEK